MKNRSLFFDTSLIYFIVIACFVGVRIFSSYATYDSIVSNSISVVIQVGLMFFLPFMLYKMFRNKDTKQVLKDFNVRPINLKSILLTILIGIIIYFLNFAVAAFFNIFTSSIGYDPSFGMASDTTSGYTTAAFISDIFLTAVLPGICEEICHRGLLVNGFKQLSPVKTVILVGLLFGLMHLNVQQFFYASVIGMFLTALVYLTGSIIPSMIVHFLNNFIGLYLTFAESNNLPFGGFSNSLITFIETTNPILCILTIFIIVATLVVLLFMLVKVLTKQTRMNQLKGIAKEVIKEQERKDFIESFGKTEGVLGDYSKEKQQILNSMKPKRKTIMINFDFNKNLLYGDNSTYAPSFKDKIFLYASLFAGIAITIATMLWGMI